MLMMMRADDSYSPETVEGCTATELLACITADDYDACIAECSGGDEPEPEVLPGYAKVTTKAAAAQNVALNAVDKKIGTVTLTAGDNDTTVTNIEITKAGLGSKDDVLNIQLVDKNGEYVTSEGKLNSSNVAKLRFRPNLTIKAKKSETFDVVVSMAGSGKATPNGQHEFSVTAVTVANGSFGGTPAKLGSLTTTNYLVSTVSADMDNQSVTVKAGDELKQIAGFTLESPVDATINSVTLTSDEDELNKAFANAKAYIDDVEVGSVSINDETITISNLNKEITKEDTINVVLKAEPIYVGSGKTFVLSIDNNHVNAIEKNTQERMAYTKNITTSTVTVDGVNITITRLSKENQTVAPGQKVTLLDLEIKSSADLDVTQFVVDFGTNPTDFSIFNESEVTLYVDGVDYALTGDKTFTDKYDAFSVSANGSVKVYITATAKTGGTVDPITFQIKEVKNLETNKTIDVTASNIKKAGHSTTIADGSYTVVRPTTMPTNKTVVAGEDEDILYFNMKASSEDLLVKTIKVQADRDFSEFATEVALVKDGRVLETVTDLENTGTELLASDIIEFNNFGTARLTKDATTEFTVRVAVKGDTVSTLGTSFKVDMKDQEVVRAAKTSVSVSAHKTIEGRTYQIASTKPTVAINSQTAGNTVLEFGNNSTYDVNLQTLTFKVTQDRVDGGYTNLSGSVVNFLDAINGSNAAAETAGSCSTGSATTQSACEATAATYATWADTSYCLSGTTTISTGQTACTGDVGVRTLSGSCSTGSATTQFACEATAATYATWTAGSISGIAGSVPGTVVITFPVDEMLGSTALTRVIEIVNNVNTISEDDYTVAVKEMTFKYVDRNDSTKSGSVITETYDVSK